MRLLPSISAARPASVGRAGFRLANPSYTRQKYCFRKGRLMTAAASIMSTRFAALACVALALGACGKKEASSPADATSEAPGAADSRAPDAAPSTDHWTSISGEFIGPAGEAMGTVTLSDALGGVLVRIEASGFAPGWHGAHLHMVADCADGAAGFKASGGHVDPEDHDHGLVNPAGSERGDLPNLFAHMDGNATAEFFRHRRPPDAKRGKRCAQRTLPASRRRRLCGDHSCECGRSFIAADRRRRRPRCLRGGKGINQPGSRSLGWDNASFVLIANYYLDGRQRGLRTYAAPSPQSIWGQPATGCQLSSLHSTTARTIQLASLNTGKVEISSVAFAPAGDDPNKLLVFYIASDLRGSPIISLPTIGVPNRTRRFCGHIKQLRLGLAIARNACLI